MDEDEAGEHEEALSPVTLIEGEKAKPTKAPITKEAIVYGVLLTGNIDQLKAKVATGKYRWSAKAVEDAIKDLEKIKKPVPAALKELQVELPVTGRGPGKPVGIGGERQLAITNTNNDKPVPASVRVPLSLYKQAYVLKAKVKVKYETDHVVIRFV